MFTVLATVDYRQCLKLSLRMSLSIETLPFYDFPVNLQPVRKTKELKQSMHYNLAAPVETFCQGTKDAVWRLII